MLMYTIGLMLYKFGVDVFFLCFFSYVLNRYDNEILEDPWRSCRTFARLGLIAGLIALGQCIGSIAVGPLVDRFSMQNILATTALVFGVLSTTPLMVEGLTGGDLPNHNKGQDVDLSDGRGLTDHFGNYNTDFIIPIPVFCSIAYGMQDVIRRLIPGAIVGGNLQKLRRMNALVHICYTFSGVVSCLITIFGLVPYLGLNFAPLITPVSFSLAGVVWLFIRLPHPNKRHSGQDEMDILSAIEQHLTTLSPTATEKKTTRKEALVKYVKRVCKGFLYFFESAYVGARIVLGHRKFIWLLPSYSLATYTQRLLETIIAPAIARRYLGRAEWSLIMLAGCNMGQLLGALLVICFTNRIRTPIPWLRLTACTLPLVWLGTLWSPSSENVSEAFIAAAAVFLPVSLGNAVGDVSLGSYIQAAASRHPGVEGRRSRNKRLSSSSSHNNIPASQAVLSFLYFVYIVVFGASAKPIGVYMDAISDKQNMNIATAIKHVVAHQYTALGGLILLSTFLPKGALAWNPDMLFEENLESDGESSVGTTISTSMELSDRK